MITILIYFEGIISNMNMNCLICKKDSNGKWFCSKECRTSPKAKEIILNRRKQTNLEKFGVENPFQSPKIKKEIKQINLKNLGFENPFQSPKIKEQIKQVNLKKRGVENPSQSKEVQAIRTKTFQDRYHANSYVGSEQGKKEIKLALQNKYDVDNVSQLESVQIKKKENCLKKRGVDHPSKTQEFKSKKEKTNLERYKVKVSSQCPSVKETTKKNNIEKYGVPFIGQVESVKENIRKRNLEKYFKNHIMQFSTVSPLFSINDYKGSKKIKYLWKCKKCGQEFLNYIDSGIIPICRKCNPPLCGSSIAEHELQNWLEQYIPIERNKRYFENGKYKYELDVFISEKNTGIEFNGTYTHSEIGGQKSPIYHLEKSEYFLNKNIQVIHIFENEWIQKQDIVKSIILAKLGLIKEKIFARKCEIKELKYKDCSQFLFHNHIQGEVKSSINLGLFYDDELVSLMTLGKSRYNKKCEYELLRYCNKLNANVIGGFSRLLSYFVKTYNPKSLITYADRRFSTGNVYLKNGFKLVNISGPNYFYMKDHFNLKSRINYQKHKLSKILPIFNPNLTEWENMQLNGYDRIWDCGNLVFSYTFSGNCDI